MTEFAGMPAAYLRQQNCQTSRLVVTQGQHFRDECGPASAISRGGANSSVPQHGKALLQGPILLASSGGLVQSMLPGTSLALGLPAAGLSSLAHPAEM